MTHLRLAPSVLFASLAAGALALFPGTAAAQGPPEAAVDPTLPVKPGFDVERAYIGRQPLFQPLHDPTFSALRDALEEGYVSRDTPMLVFAHGESTLSLVTSQMSYHHVAQGEMAGEPWMVTF